MSNYLSSHLSLFCKWSPAFFDWGFNYKRQDGPGQFGPSRLAVYFPSQLHSIRHSSCFEISRNRYPVRFISPSLSSHILMTDGNLTSLTHGPAFGIFDRTTRGDLAGCEALLSRLAELRPRLHLSGHIHEAHGAHVHDWTRDVSGNYAVPVVQNEEMSDSDSDSDTVDERKPSSDSGPSTEKRREGDDREFNFSEGLNRLTLGAGNVSRTVFVNAANWPSGRHAWRATTAGNHDKRRVPFGGLGFQAVVVDLKDDITV